MQQKQIGYTIIVFSLILALFVYSAYAKEERYINAYIHQAGTCYLDDGTCLHQDRDYSLYIIGWTISASLLLFGLYLSFIDKTQDKLYEHQTKISKALEKSAKQESFDAFLQGFNADEQKVLKIIHLQDGVTQSTLRYKTDMSKTSLSLLLKDLEKKEIIYKKPKGKTYQVFMKKSF